MADSKELKIITTVDTSNALQNLAQLKATIEQLNMQISVQANITANERVKAEQTVSSTVQSESSKQASSSENANRRKVSDTKKRTQEEILAEKQATIDRDVELKKQLLQYKIEKLKELEELTKIEKERKKIYNKSLSEEAAFAKKQGTANYTLVQFSRLLSDAPYFMTSFQMGLIAITNNIDPLVQQFVQLKKEAKEGETVFGLLKQSLTGVNGIMVGISLVTSIITAFALATRDSSKATKEKTEALKKQNQELAKYKSLLSEIVVYEDPITKKQYRFENKEDLGRAIKELEKYKAELEKTDPSKNREKYVTRELTQGMTFDEVKQYNKQVQEQANAQAQFNTELLKTNAVYKALSEQYNKFVDINEQVDILRKSGASQFAIFENKGNKNKVTKEIKDIENQYQELYDELRNKLLRFTLSEEEYAKEIAWFEYYTRISSYDKLVLEEGLTQQEANRLRIIDHEGYRKELEEIDKKYSRKKERAFADISPDAKERKRLEQERINALKEEYATINILAESAANTLREGFMQAWTDIFGQANSLFEKFMANIVSQLANLAAQQVATNIFSGILGLMGFGVGGGAGAAIAAVAGASGAGRPVSQTTLNVILDGQIIDKRVVNNFGNYQTIARNRRLA